MVKFKGNATKLLILVNRWCRSLGLNLPLSHPMDYFSQDYIIQYVYNVSMARRSCLRDILSRGITAYSVNRIEYISISTQYSGMLNCSNP